MSKLTGELSYKDWCILKHALEKRVKVKQDIADIIEKEVKGLDKKQYFFKKFQKIKKELAEEKSTLERVTKLTNNFKRYISGSERHYMHRSVDCD